MKTEDKLMIYGSFLIGVLGAIINYQGKGPLGFITVTLLVTGIGYILGLGIFWIAKRTLHYEEPVGGSEDGH